MTTIRTERFEIKTTWSDGSTSTEHRESRLDADDLANRNRAIGNVTDVTVTPVMKTIAA